jgi:rfaE bifunctional protein nucleotidyltransferase chain/domain
MISNELISFLDASSGKKIVFTNGCFDIVHRGHITYLNEAKALGDLLVIGLNSDKSVKRLKGDQRPINNQDDRKYLLENLRSVDFVEIFEEDTPLNLITHLLPSVLVKGGDWKIEEIVGSKEVITNGGEVYSLNFVDGFSTTNIIEKIKK